MFYDHDRRTFGEATSVPPSQNGEHRKFSSYIKQLMAVTANRIVKNGNAFKVMSALIDRAHSDHGNAWPSIRSLCEDTGLSAEQVRDALRYLEGYRKDKHHPELSVLDIERSTGGYNGETHNCTPRWQLAFDLKANKEAAKVERAVAQLHHVPGPLRKSQEDPSEISKGSYSAAIWMRVARRSG